VRFTYRMFQEEKSVFWEFIVSAILVKNVYVHVSEVEIFHFTVPKLLKRKRD
jgi:hypothetical protein